jgi:hypothetical protein
MTGTNCDLFTHKSSRSYLNHLVLYLSSLLSEVFVCSAQYGCFLYFLDFVLSRCVTHVFSEWFWESFPAVSVIASITFSFTFHMRCISGVMFLYYRIFSASLLNTFLSSEIATSINTHVSFSLSRTAMPSLLFGMVLSVSTCWFHSMVTVSSWLVSTDFGTCLYQCYLSNFTPEYVGV